AAAVARRGEARLAGVGRDAAPVVGVREALAAGAHPTVADAARAVAPRRAAAARAAPRTARSTAVDAGLVGVLHAVGAARAVRGVVVATARGDGQGERHDDDEVQALSHARLLAHAVR